MIRLITGLIGWVFGVLLVYVAGWGETRLVNVAVPLMSGFIAIFLAEAYKKRRPKF
jgi:hypothetical protein